MEGSYKIRVDDHAESLDEDAWLFQLNLVPFVTCCINKYFQKTGRPLASFPNGQFTVAPVSQPWRSCPIAQASEPPL